MLASLLQTIKYVVLISQLCHSQQCRTKKGDSCIFPFEYQNKIYTGCKPDIKNPDRPWCSTDVDSEGRHITGSGGVTWGVCSSECPVDVNSTCAVERQCIQGGQCSEFKEFRKMPKNHTEYESEITKWKARVCNKKQRKLLCCPKLKLEPLTLTKQPAPTRKPVIKTNVCEGGQVYRGKYLPTLGQCGKFCATGRIHGGVNAGLGEFPWAALLGYTIQRRIQEYPSQEWVIRNRTAFRCGGTLINTRYVLTAAHCHSDANKITSVVLGEWEVGKNPDCPEGSRDRSACLPRKKQIKVESVTIHENYKKDKTNGEVVNDIALIRLKKNAVLNEAVQPVCLPINEEVTTEEIGIENLNDGIVGRDSTIIGWGRTDNFVLDNSKCQGVPHCILQKLDIPIISNDDCQSKVNEVSQNSTIRSSHICAFSNESKDKDSCKGDSGGGMFISKNKDHKTDDTYYQVGIVSYGLSKYCGIGYPGVYTRISEFLPWIEENLED